jgi:hypothetical protein
MKTKYRVYHDGYHDYLQYEDSINFIGFKIKSTWRYIPHLNSISTIIPPEQDYYISDNNFVNFDEFVEKYPNITDYLYEYEITRKAFEQRLNDKYTKNVKVIKEYE